MGLEHAVEGIRRAPRGGLAARTVSLKAGAALLRVPNSPQVQGGCRGVPGGRTAKNVVLTQIRHGARFGCRNCERNTLLRPRRKCSVCEAEVLRDSVRRVQSGPGPPVKLRHTAKVLQEPSRGRAEEQSVVGGRESDEYTSRPVR